VSQPPERATDELVLEEEPSATPGVADARRARRAQNRRRAVYEWVIAIVVAVLVAFVIKTWVAQTFVIPSGSMEDTLLVKDRVLVSKLSYRFGDIERGDVIVFDNPECKQSDACTYRQLIKRVIGVPGDVVTTNTDQKVVVNGEVIDEPYLKPNSTTTMRGACNLYGESEVVTVAPHQLLVMGDNRNLSKDGRCFGPVDESDVVGRAFLRVWPLNRIGGL
jgi:signal peptidase I